MKYEIKKKILIELWKLSSDNGLSSDFRGNAIWFFEKHF